MQANNTILCGNGLRVNLDTYNATISTQQGVIIPKSFSYMDNDTFVHEVNTKGKIWANQDGSFISSTLIKRGNSYQNIVMSDALTASMFTRLFFHEGAGLEHFEKFSDLTDVTGSRIIVWKVNWEGKSNNEN